MCATQRGHDVNVKAPRLRWVLLVNTVPTPLFRPPRRRDRLHRRLSYSDASPTRPRFVVWSESCAATGVVGLGFLLFVVSCALVDWQHATVADTTLKVCCVDGSRSSDACS